MSPKGNCVNFVAGHYDDIRVEAGLLIRTPHQDSSSGLLMVSKLGLERA